MGIKGNYLNTFFAFKHPTFMLKTLLNRNGKKKNNELVNIIKSGLKDLEEEIEEMSEYVCN